jgi:predicted acylesterase/phospholipase RssA
MPKRLAITIAGAVSLGSYEAGVLYEVLDAIHQHNAADGVTDDEKILIDVMTGASAGAMTAAIVAQNQVVFDQTTSERRGAASRNPDGPGDLQESGAHQ